MFYFLFPPLGLDLTRKAWFLIGALLDLTLKFLVLMSKEALTGSD
jgi:hypothetical protein